MRRRIAVRADLDALPVMEETGLPFSSENPGVMHCCGHDMHSSLVAGLAEVLAQMPGELAGDVRFIFQPAEEGGRSTSRQPNQAGVALSARRGAQRMMDEGALDGVDAIVGIHCWPDLPVGKLGLDPKAAMAGNAALRVRVISKGGHGATHHKTVDPVPVTASVILALQTIASRKNNPSNPFVLTIGSIHGGTTSNVIPDDVEFAATLRSYTPRYLETAVPPLIEQMVRGIVEGCGGTVDIDYKPGLPPVINDKVLVDAFAASARHRLGRDAVVILEDAAMTSEDFAYYGTAAPSLYVKLGVAGEGGCPPLHSARFSPDERALSIGIRALAGFVLDYLSA